ncbi:hypothetical protein A3K78_06550 [Candidatus Bathyarchaeota archaeon RBG_13_52_12]|nr:MAG: hypothetical protein A3K78_06550 [Candidatus Bathyarchaeota archaeon RBG_13_52_12]
MRKPLILLLIALAVTGSSILIFLHCIQTVSHDEFDEEPVIDTSSAKPPLTNDDWALQTNETVETPEKFDVSLEATLVPVVTWYPDIGESLYGEWLRGNDDLPYFNFSYTIYVTNHGKKIAYNVSIVVTDRDVAVFNETKNLGPSYMYIKTVKGYAMRYDNSHGLYLHVQCHENIPEIVTAFRYFNVPWIRINPTIRPTLVKLYITPQNPTVQNVLRLAENTSDWRSVIQWVDSTITYEKHREWHLGHETLESGTGDALDKALLICSLLRGMSWDPEDVYVAWSKTNEGQAAWVVFRKLPNVEWLKVGFTNGLVIETFQNIELAQGEADILFNDIEFKNLPSSS